MNTVEVKVTIEACGEHKSITVDLLTKEIAGFSKRIEREVYVAAANSKVGTYLEDERQAGLSREYRRGCRDGRQEAYTEVVKGR